MGARVTSVAVVGSGLAAWLCAAQLCAELPDTIAVTVVGGETDAPHDALYGGVLPPEVYGLHTRLGLGEPDLVLGTGTAFAFGARISGWGRARRSWVQPFHLPVPAFEGVPLHILLAGRDNALQGLLISAAAAQAGRFAHPPDDRDHPLSSAEYGYLVDPAELTARYRELAARARVVSALQDVERDGARVTGLRLADGSRQVADLYVDATGPTADLLGPGEAARQLGVSVERTASAGVQAPLALIAADGSGLSLSSTTRSRATTLRVTAGDDLPVHQQSESWRANVVAVGQSACTVEPLTLAPMRLLLRDTERLLALFPIDTDMAVERGRYNAAARDDQDHALCFHYAHFAEGDLPDTPYWQEARTWSHPKLDRKLQQYAARAYLVGFDHEPFHPLDWAVLHSALGRQPERHDPMARQVPARALDTHVEALEARVQDVVRRMPPHPLYMAKLIDYLQRKHAGGRHAG